MSSLALVGLLVSLQTASPRFVLTKGQSVAYDVSMTYTDTRESDITTKQEWRLTYSSIGERMEGSRKLLKMEVDGQAIKLDKVDVEKWTEVRNPRGEVMARTIADDQDYMKRRWIRLFDLSYPTAALRRGLSWTATDEQNDVPALSKKYTVDSIDDDLFTLKFQGNERGNGGWTMTGDMRCDKRTGWPRDMRGTVEHFVFPDDEEKRVYRLEFTAKRVTN